MVSTFTPNIQLEEPARGDYVGTWDTPVNANMTLIDLVAGGQTSITLNNSPVVLSAAQFQCTEITFASTLTGSVTITFPTSFKKPYSVYHTCTGSSAFTITLQTTAAGGEVIAIPPGVFSEVINDGTNLRFRGLERIGSYWDYAGSSVPNWVSGCTKAPYLNCDGTAFSSATYPQLATILGGTTLPDARGRYRLATDQSAGRVSSAVAGFSPTTVGAGGGLQSQTLGSSNLPAHNHPVNDPGHLHGPGSGSSVFWTAQGSGAALSGGSFGVFVTASQTATANTGLTVSNSTYANSALAILPPTYVGGLTLIRAG
jgi:microcystin-dependent protein